MLFRSPVSGRVIAVNEALEDSPELVNESPYGDGWFFKLQADDPTELENLLDSQAYQQVCENEEH